MVNDVITRPKLIFSPYVAEIYFDQPVCMENK
jgi:hypothetical protein